MATAQQAIFATDNPHQHHLELVLRAGIKPSELAARLGVARASDRHAVNEHAAVVGIGLPVAQALLSEHVPDDLSDFSPIGDASTWSAPSTQADLWIWLQGDSRDRVHDRAMAYACGLAEVARVTLDMPVFQRAENRDLLGFVDGTANPKDDLRFDAALIAEGCKGEGGSIALTQQWRHDVCGFAALAVATQEAVIGRTKVDDVELLGDAMPADSHLSRTDLKVDGQAMKIYRRSAPYGNATDHGLLFVAFACEQRRIQLQLESMFGMTPDGLHDRMIEFSAALTGSYWFVPSAELLEDLG
jgi:porphyrinogen peroxidase